jgi:hypothetical protein
VSGDGFAPDGPPTEFSFHTGAANRETFAQELRALGVIVDTGPWPENDARLVFAICRIAADASAYFAEVVGIRARELGGGYDGCIALEDGELPEGYTVDSLPRCPLLTSFP